MNRDIEPDFNRIYQTTSRATLAYLTARTGSREDAADLFQEVYEELIRVLRRKGGDYIDEPEAFVRKLAKSRLSRRLKKPKTAELPMAFQSEDEGDELERWLDSGFRVEDDVAHRDLVEKVCGYVDGCCAAEREVFYLRFGAEMTFGEIAGELGLPEATVKSRLYRLIAKIRENIEF